MSRALGLALCVMAGGAVAVAQPAVESMPLLVGGHAHGTANIRYLADLELGNFVWIPAKGYSMGNTPWDDEHDILADVRACVEAGLAFMVTERRGMGAIERGGGFTRGGHCSWDYHDAATVGAITELAGGLFIGLHAEELDADLVQQTVRPAFGARSPELYAYTDRAGGRAAFETELARIRDLYAGFGAGFIPNLCVTHHLSGFRVRPRLVIAELFEHLPTVELQLAYLRGGQTQFGVPWGVWVSPWYYGQVPCEDKDMWPNSMAQPGGGHAADAFRRALYLSFVSGARLLTCQETEPLASGDGEGGVRLGPWGRELHDFWQYARAHDEELRPLAPLAFLVDVDNGWEPAYLWQNWNPHESVWGSLPIDRRGDGMLREFVNAFLPGFMRTAEAVRERRDHYPGKFAATPRGPFDILATDASAAALDAYPVVALMGGVRMTPELVTTLRAYVENGGVLVVNAYHMMRDAAFVEAPELLGARLSELPGWRYDHVIYASSRIRRVAELPGVAEEVYDEPWFVSVRVALEQGSEVVAEDGDGVPVLVRNRIGRGTVYLSLAEYCLEGYGQQTTPLRFFVDLLSGLAREKSTVHVESGSDLSWIASAQAGDEADADVVLVLANHAEDAREAVFVHRLDPASSAALEIGVGPLQPLGDGRFRVLVPAKDVALVRLTAQQPVPAP